MRCSIIFLSLFLSTFSAFAQTNLETFGKSRVQYKKFDWRYFESGRFKIHYYDRGGAELARFVAEQVDNDIRSIERAMNSSFPSNLNIILYNNYSDYLQSNVDFETHKEVPISPAGQFKLVGDKLVVYYDGMHNHLKNQLRQGLAQVIVERVMFGGDIKSFAKNAVSQKIPSWVTQGYIDYTVFGWEVDMEEDLKQILKDEKIVFEDIVRNNEQLAGKLFWKYISETKGKQEVRNLFIFILNKNNFKTAISQMYNQKLNDFLQSILKHFRERYEFEKTLAEDPNFDDAYFTIKPKNDQIEISQVMVSPRGLDVAYLEWENGECRVVMEKTYNQKGTNERVKSTIFRTGITDHEAEQDINYPIIAWSNTGFQLAIVHMKGGKIYIRVYDAIKATFVNYQIRHNRFDRIQGVTFMEEDQLIILSAIKNAQSDIFEYRLKTGQFKQLTDDPYDDLSPVYVAGGSRKGIIFMSNRPEPFMNIKPLPNELPTGPINAFFYNYTTKNDSIMQLTHNNADFMSEVISYGHDHFAYLSSHTGINNRYVILFNRNQDNLDTPYSVPVTNYSSSIVNHQYNPASQKVAEVIQLGREYKVYFRPMELPQPLGTAEVKSPILIRSVEDKSRDFNIVDETVKDIEKPYFKIEKGDAFIHPFSFSQSSNNQNGQSLNHSTSTDNLSSNSSSNLSLPDSADLSKIIYVDSTYIKMRSSKYFNTFRTVSISAKFDNSQLFNKYQSYAGNFGRFNNSDMGGMLTMELKDRLEDHKLTFGGRLALDGSKDLFVKYDNLKRRLDWGISAFTSSSTRDVQVGLFIPGQGTTMAYQMPVKSLMTFGQVNFNYPLDRVRSIRAYLSLRQDRGIMKSTNLPALIVNDLKDVSFMGRLEFVQDNTKTFSLNLHEGMKYNVYGEYFNKFISENDFFRDGNGLMNNSKGGFYAFGFDWRNYSRIYRDIVVANRIAGAHSAGTQQILYVLGGVDNPIDPDYNNLLQPSPKNNYAFQMLATNLRGYPQNARNGNTYFASNNEIRVPIMSTISNRTINSLFLKHLQIVGFVDIGSAWEGLAPLNQQSRKNTFYYPDPINPQSIVTVPYPFNSGVAIGYGLGLRMYAWSYLIRVDYARNIDNKGMLHISLGFDF